MTPLPDTTYVDVAFNGVDLTNRDLKGCTFVGCNFRKVRAEGADFSGATFVGSNLQFISAKGAKFEGAAFIECDLEKADFRDTNFVRAKFDDCWWTNTVFQNADFTHADFSHIHELETAWIYPIKADGKYFKIIDAQPFGAVITKRTMMLGCLHKTQKDWFAMSELTLAVNTCGDENANPEWKKWRGELANRLPAWCDALEDME